MIEYGKVLKQRLDEILQNNGSKRGYWIYPFGEGGKITKSLLNIEHDIIEKGIIDNKLSEKYPKKIYSIERAKEKINKGDIVLLTSYRRDIHDELYKTFCEKIEGALLVDIFHDIDVMVKEDYEIQHKQHKDAHDRVKRVIDKIEQGALNKYLQYNPKYTNSKFYLPYVVTDFIQQTIFLSDDYFESKVLNYVFNEFDGGEIGKKCRGGVFVDAGANIGNHSLYFANEIKADTIYAFEAIKETYNILKKNININELGNVILPYNYGLSDHNGRASIFNYDYDNIGGSAIMMNKSNDERISEIEIVTLDGELLHKNKKVSFLKVDVEGMEMEVIKGSSGIIERDLPTIMIESFIHFKELQDRLYPLGYRSFSLGTNDYLFYVN